MKIVVQSSFNNTNWEDYQAWRQWMKSEAISSVKQLNENEFVKHVRFRVISRTEKVLYPKS